MGKIIRNLSAQVEGGVGSKLCSRDTDIYITCGAQPDKSFGAVYHLSLGKSPLFSHFWDVFT